VTSKLNQIEPRVDPSKYRVHLHEVRDEQGQGVQDTWVVEIVVPASDSSEPYYTGGGDAWVKSMETSKNSEELPLPTSSNRG